MSGVDLIEQRAAAYHFDQKSTIRLYLCGFFFDLMGLVCASMYIVYNMMHPNDLTLLDFKTIVSTCFIGRFTSPSRAPPDGKIGSESISISYKIFGDDVNTATKREKT